jgi:flagellar biosynthesis protein FlhG
MPDQAYDLRRLATHCHHAVAPRRSARPVLAVVAGGKGGVGTTTVAIGLAAAVARTGKRTLLIDADARGGDVGLLCGIEQQHTLADVLAGRRTWAEATCAGPEGVRLVVGQRGWQECGSAAANAGHLLEQMDRESLAADVVVIDAGSSLYGVMPHVCHEANAVLLVTTSDAAAVVDTFATIKMLMGRQECPPRQGGWPNYLSHQESCRAPCYVLVNMAATAGVAKTVYYRLARTCRRVLGTDLHSAGHLPKARLSAKNVGHDTIGLNLQVSFTDTLRGVFAADALLK